MYLYMYEDIGTLLYVEILFSFKYKNIDNDPVFSPNIILLHQLRLDNKFKLNVIPTFYVYFVGQLNNSGTSFYQNIANTSNATIMVIHMDYTVSFPIPSSGNCPILYLRHEYQDYYYNTHNGCFDKDGIQKNTDFDKKYWWFGGCSKPATAPSYCHVNTSSNLVQCSKIFEMSIGYTSFWYVSVGYFCGENETLNMKYKVTLMEKKRIACTEFDTENEVQNVCSAFYSHFAIPNYLGYDKEDTSMVMTTTAKALHNTKCYQHLYELACRAFLPNCNVNNTLALPPCRQMCLDWQEGCASQLHGAFSTECTTFPNTTNSEVCVYKTANCLDSAIPEHGTAMYKLDLKAAMDKVTYSCNEPYTLVGDNSRTCLYGGHWNGTIPECSKTSPTVKIMIILIIVFVIIAIILTIFITVAAKYKLEIKTFLNHRQTRNTVLTPPIKTYNAFISYDPHSNDDVIFVRNTLSPGILQGRPGTILCTDEDLDPGMPMAAAIEKALWDSSAIIMLLSQHNVDSEYLEYTFKLAQDINSTDKNFIFVVILFEPIRNLQNLQEYMKKYLAFGKRFNIVRFVSYDHINLGNIIREILKL